MSYKLLSLKLKGWMIKSNRSLIHSKFGCLCQTLNDCRHKTQNRKLFYAISNNLDTLVKSHFFPMWKNYIFYRNFSEIFVQFFLVSCSFGRVVYLLFFYRIGRQKWRTLEGTCSIIFFLDICYDS